MSWWKEEKIGNKKFVTLRSFNIRVFVILLVIGIIVIALRLFEK